LRAKKDAKRPKFRESQTDDHDAVRRRRASANRTLTVLKAALNRGWREGKIPSDEPWRRVEPFEDADAARVRYLTIAEAKRLLNASEADFRRLAQAALVTGARYGELAALRTSDFNPDSGTIHVRTSKSGKGRHIVLNDEGAALFESLAAGKVGDALLLPKADGSVWAKSHQSRPMAEACQRAKIKPVASFHILRHTWASLAIMAGAPLLVVARNLGHADTRMVERHYGHLAPSYVADAIRAAAPRFDIQPERKVASIAGRA
jgi:integrase